jgi:hypothetical protein
MDFEMREAARLMTLGGAIASSLMKKVRWRKPFRKMTWPRLRSSHLRSRTLTRLRTEAGSGLLAEAVNHGNRDIVDVLLQAGANVNHREDSGRTPLMSLSEKPAWK